MITGFFLDQDHQVYEVRIAGKSTDTKQTWFDVDRIGYTQIIVTNSANIFTTEIAAKKTAFLRLLKNKEYK